MARSRKKVDSDYTIRTHDNNDAVIKVLINQKEETLPFVFGIMGVPSLRHAPQS